MDYIEKRKEGIYGVQYQKYLDLFFETLNIKVSSSSDGILFKADSIEKLDKLDISLLENFIYDLGYQILILKKLNQGILFLNTHNIVVLNSNHFLIINPNVILSLSSENEMYIPEQINQTLSTSSFLSPEVKNITSYPTSIYYSSSFYSLAALILYIFNINLKKIYYSNSYYFLTRCLIKNPHERFLLFI